MSISGHRQQVADMERQAPEIMKNPNLPSGVRKAAESDADANVRGPSTVSQLRITLGPLMLAWPGPPGRHGAWTSNRMAGAASLPPTVQISLHPPKSRRAQGGFSPCDPRSEPRSKDHEYLMISNRAIHSRHLVCLSSLRFLRVNRRVRRFLAYPGLL